MKIIFPDGTVKDTEIEKTSIDNLLKDLKINPVEVIVAKNGKIVLVDEMIIDDDEIKIVRVIHGG